MYRYVALSWDPDEELGVSACTTIVSRLLERSAQWTAAYESAGLIVYHAGAQEGHMQSYPITGTDGQRGVVLGKLFARPEQIETTIAPNIQLDALQAQKILKTNGQELIDAYWGRYVAFATSATNSMSWVLRDPIGGFSCYQIVYKGVHIFFSDLEALDSLEFLDLSLDWDAIAIYLKYLFLPGNRTGYKHITKLSPGERLTIRHRKCSRDILWNACEISQSEIINDPYEAAQLVRNLTMNCVAAWAGNYNNILHRLGGLDSSIVLACLNKMESGPKITCFNYYTTEGLDGDERVYARMAAQHAGVPLVEQKRSVSDIDPKLLYSIRREPRPDTYYWHAIELSGFEVELANATGAEATFSGVGGDQVFFMPARNYGVSDYVKRHGLRLPLFKYAKEAAQIQNISLWSALKAGIKSGFSRGPFSPINEVNRAFYNTATINHEKIKPLEAKGLADQSFTNAAKVGEGKLRQIFLCKQVLDYNGMFLPPNHVAPVDPLFSQPLVELCLRIPTWILAKGGMKRGLARYAFAEDVPIEIIRRQSKASAQNYFWRLLKENEGFFENCLMRGVLARNDLLNGDVVGKCLSDSYANAEIPRLLSHIGLEAWLARNSTSDANVEDLQPQAV